MKWLLAAIAVMLALVLALLASRPAGAEELPTEQTIEAAAWVGIDPVELQGAVNSSRLDPVTYLYAVGHLQAPARREFTAADTHAAIAAAAERHGVSASWLRRVVSCETGGTFNPYAAGDWRWRNGRLVATSHGPVQLNDLPTGLLWDFYDRGYTDPNDPKQALDYMARAFKGELRGISAGRWSCQ